MYEKYYYEKRKIENMLNETYYIWEIYKKNKFGIVAPMCVFHSEDDFNSFKSNHCVEFKKFSERGIE